MSGEHVLVCVAWPYANGPLHLGHVAGCYLPPDIQARFERSKGNKVLMVSGSDEHGTPITVAAETQGVNPQDIVDKYHAMNSKALLDLGCSWEPKIDPLGSDYGGSLFNRTSDPEHHEIVSENFVSLLNAGLFERKVMQQYYEIREDGGRFLPDRYVEGDCPNCGATDARGDQCDECGVTYEATELQNPRSKMNPDAEIEIRVRYPSEYRKLESLDNLKVNTVDGAVPISRFTERQAKTRVDTIQRIDMMETVFILANTGDGYLTNNQVKQIERWLMTQDIDPSVKISFRGANEEQAESAEFLSTAFSLAMGLMLILLVAQFNSFYQSFLILFAVVMSTAGVLLGLLISQTVFSTILTGVGIVALAGIVVNNNIVLIDSYNFLRRSNSDLSAEEAIYEAAKSGFRAVMLTTVTTIAGLLPLATGISVDMINRKIEIDGMVASWWQPLASAIVNGLLLATVMTLLLTPAMLLLPSTLRRLFGSNPTSQLYSEDDAK